MYFKMDWRITLGDYFLSLLAGVEIHKSVDLLSDTCSITLPGFAYNKAFQVEDRLHRGDTVTVELGYDGNLVTEFTGYILNINSDDGTLTINCEDELFLLRKAVKDKQFKHATVKEIVQYCLDQAGTGTTLNTTFGDGFIYDKFVISKATAYDVLKKIQEETKANIYMRLDETKKVTQLNIHPLYSETHGYAYYSFQQNIEKGDLKYKREIDKTLMVIVENVGKDGKTHTVQTGKTGGDKQTIKVTGLSKEAMQMRANAEYKQHCFDGYEGSFTGWLIPHVLPGDSTYVFDEDYDYKNGSYFTTAVTTKFNENGGSREVQIGIKLTGNGQTSATKV